MYDTGRETALDVVGDVYGDKSVELRNTHGLQGVEKIRAIAAIGDWWAELYAAEQMRNNPILRDPVVIEELKNSDHSVIRKAMQDIENTK